MNYGDMSDFEINKLVAGVLYGEDWWHKNERVIVKRQGLDIFGDKMAGKVDVDYCNCPSDAYPVIFENKISISPYDLGKESEEYEEMKDMWFAMKDFETCVDHKNPLRAAMIVFLMMNEKD